MAALRKWRFRNITVAALRSHVSHMSWLRLWKGCFGTDRRDMEKVAMELARPQGEAVAATSTARLDAGYGLAGAGGWGEWSSKDRVGSLGLATSGEPGASAPALDCPCPSTCVCEICLNFVLGIVAGVSLPGKCRGTTMCASLLSPPRVWRRSARWRGPGATVLPCVWLCSSAHGTSWRPAGVLLRGPLVCADTFCSCVLSLGRKPKAQSAPTSALGCVRARRPKNYDPSSWRTRPSMNRSGPAGQAVGG